MRTPVNRRAAFQALFVTFLWSTSWILIKQGLQEIPPITFAGLRYAIASSVLLPGLWRRRAEVASLTRGQWGQLTVLGLFFYALTQGGQFVTLNHLQAIPFSLILSFTPLLVAATGAVALGERPSRLQWIGVALGIAGAVIYFAPSNPFHGAGLGFALAGLTLCANTVSSLLGRAVNRRRVASPIVVTSISMSIGAIFLLAVGLGSHGLPSITIKGWGIIVWLAVVNTSFAFTLWNHTLRILSATESSIINNTMLIQIAVLAWIFLGETLGTVQILGLLAVAFGTAIVQLRRRSPKRGPNQESHSHDRPSDRIP